MAKKKWLKCPYKKEPGVYKLINNMTNDFYIGSSKSIYVRYYTHMNRLDRRSHDNHLIREASMSHGKSDFSFEVLEYCDISNILIREQFYIDLLKPTYNRWSQVLSPKGFKHFSISKEKMVKNRKDIKDKDAFRAKLRAAWARRKLLPGYEESIKQLDRTGMEHSAETRSLFSLQRKGVPKPEGFGDKIRKSRLGKTWLIKN